MAGGRRHLRHPRSRSEVSGPSLAGIPWRSSVGSFSSWC
jgi:hypothetical protein